MKSILFTCFIIVIAIGQLGAQSRQAALADMRAGGQRPDRYGGTTMHSDWDNGLVSITKRCEGFVVYRGDTLHGLIILTVNEVMVEQPVGDELSNYHTFKLKNTDLETIMMYNFDKKPLCITRVSRNDKRMLRLVHCGKLNIYDDRIAYIYEPKDIDKNYIIISSEGVVDDLSSFLTENTKRDLIGYVNDIYGLKIEPKTISWQDLLKKVDMLD